MLASRPLDLSKLIPTIERVSPRSPGSPPTNPYQAWSTNSSDYAKKLRTSLTQSSPRICDESERKVQLAWNTRKVCDFEIHRLTREFRLEFLKKVRSYHKCAMGLQNAFWEFLDSDVNIQYIRRQGIDASGTVIIFQRDGTITTTDGVSGEHLHEILSIMIRKMEERISRQVS